MESFKGLFIGLPVHSELVNVKFMQSMLNIPHIFSDYPVVFKYISSSILPKSRNDIMNFFLESECSHMMFIDSDMLFDAKNIFDLIRVCLDNDDNCISAGIYTHKHLYDEKPSLKYTIDIEKYQENSNPYTPIKSDKAPTGFMCIPKKIAKAIKDKNSTKPFFNFEWNGTDFLGEDYYFCDKVLDIGANIFLCPWIELGHIGYHDFKHTHDLYKQYYDKRK